ncbi:hypothetical protein PCASD_07295 [Puccinia coronata f. sp. avenae]|uniref:Uncharacterized protein n=1 Tax=Puccinia coronata f. sp. avenae TaxID=200324 RepID=A0A2N5URD8_9BASI|nr:hypothetical protein PCASD_07295 [Puccinia coronata f. sp. avenae]
MAARTETYLKVALECDAILIATALNPSFCLSIFKMSFPTKYNYAQGLLTNLFNTRKAIVVGTESSREPTQQVRSLLNPREQAIKDVDYFPDTIEAAPPDEMDIYLGGKYKLPTCETKNCLGWWKQRTILLAWGLLQAWRDASRQQRTHAAVIEGVLQQKQSNIV